MSFEAEKKKGCGEMGLHFFSIIKYIFFPLSSYVLKNCCRYGIIFQSTAF